MFPNELLIQLRNSRVVAGFSIENVEDAIPIAKPYWQEVSML